MTDIGMLFAAMVVLPGFRFGGMENWGMINFHGKILLFNPQTDPVQNFYYTGVLLAHELAHNVSKTEKQFSRIHGLFIVGVPAQGGPRKQALEALSGENPELR